MTGSKMLPGQVVLVLQGGGALGSYQAGVYQALHEAGIEPDWIIGTSIGAINASLIAGNEPQDRLEKLREFWRRMERNPAWGFPGAWPGFYDMVSYWSTVLGGIPAFFKPNLLAHWGDPVTIYLIVDQSRVAYWKNLINDKFHIYHQVGTYGTFVVMSNEL